MDELITSKLITYTVRKIASQVKSVLLFMARTVSHQLVTIKLLYGAILDEKCVVYANLRDKVLRCASLDVFCIIFKLWNGVILVVYAHQSFYVYLIRVYVLAKSQLSSELIMNCRRRLFLLLLLLLLLLLIRELCITKIK